MAFGENQAKGVILEAIREGLSKARDKQADTAVFWTFIKFSINGNWNMLTKNKTMTNFAIM
jgi:hypothetical protein